MSLAWQITSFVMSGRRVRAFLSLGARGASSQWLVQSFVKKKKKKTNWYDFMVSLVKLELTDPLVAVTVQNTGRSPIYVSGVSFHDADVKQLRYIPGPGAVWPKLPCALKPGLMETWTLDYQILADAAAEWRESGGGTRLQIAVFLGHGKSVRVGEPIAMSELKSLTEVFRIGKQLDD